MKQFTFTFIFCLCLAITVFGAPTESGMATDVTSTAGSTSPITTIAPSSTAADLAKSAPATDDSSKETNTTSSMAVSSTHDSFLNTSSSFTCYGRSIGYYGDVEHECKVYHFCLLGDYNGESVYQRISYLCLNTTLFDQQALDCVEPAKMTAPCKETAQFYEISNAILRQAIVGNRGEADPKNVTSTV